MSLLNLFARLFGGDGGRHNVAELSRRLDIPAEELQAIPVNYLQYDIPKRSGGKRTILAPDAKLKSIQRRILRRLLQRLKSHPAVTGFERGHSIVTNALPHVNKDVVLRMDIRNFFPSTTAKRVQKYFRRIGWKALQKMVDAQMRRD